MNDNILDLKHVSVHYETFEGLFTAVRDISFSLGYNESIGIIGESGCGKSTLSYAILRYLASNAKIEGSIHFKDQNLFELSDREMESIRGNRISMVYQNPYSSLNPSLTIGKQLDEVTIFHRGLSKAKAREASLEALELMNIGDGKNLVRRYPHQISGGIQQRIIIAMAILARPDIMVLDEPTTALDVTTEAVILDSINDLKQKLNMSFIYISHDMGVINKVAEQIIVMYNGEMVERGPKEKIFAHPFHPYTRALINCMPRGGVVKEKTYLNTIKGYVKRRGDLATGCPFADRCDKKTATCEEDYGIREVEDGHYAACARAYAEDVPAPKVKAFQRAAVIASGDQEGTNELITIKNLKKVYGLRRKVHALNGVSFSMPAGSVLGVVGESGCGKSTTGHIITGLYSPTKGKVEFKQRDISIDWRKRDSDTLRDIQLIFQNPGKSLNPSHTVEQIIARPMNKLIGRKNRKERREEIVQLLKTVDLGSDYITKKPKEMSGGEQQRVAIARALAINPELIVCDEPTSALDVSVQASVLNLLNDIQEKTGTSYIFISHDLNVINYISDTILVMYAGFVVEYGLRDEVMAPPFHPYTEALFSAVPDVDPTKKKKVIELTGALPDPSRKVKGCPFASRCHIKVGDVCDKVYPPKREISPTHYYYCHADRSSS